MFKISNKSPDYCCGFERDKYYTFEEIREMLPSCFKISKDIDENFKGAFTVIIRLEGYSFSRDVPVLIFESEGFSLG